MRTDFSEFSYGYALTEEFMTDPSESPVAAPVFPSLVQEGSVGGGYDVMLSSPGVPIFLQFKRPDYMVRGTAREISAYGLPITLPFYRMHIRSSYISRQHELLLELNNIHTHVYYGAPLFHDVSTLNRHYAGDVVRQHSIFIRPMSIGRLPPGTHHMAYDTRRRAWLCSEPREIEETTSSPGLMQTLAALLSERKEPFRERGLRESLDWLKEALDTLGLRPNPRPQWTGEELPPEKRILSQIADLSVTYFGAQFFVVKATHDGT